MHCVINGKARELLDGVTVTAFLDSEGLGAQACAVEVNQQLVPKRDHPATALCEGDSVEIVTLVGGG